MPCRLALRCRGQAKEIVLATEAAAGLPGTGLGNVTVTGTSVDEAKRLQTDADAALRRGELGKAIKGYGSAMRVLVVTPRKGTTVVQWTLFFLSFYHSTTAAPRRSLISAGCNKRRRAACGCTQEYTGVQSGGARRGGHRCCLVGLHAL